MTKSPLLHPTDKIIPKNTTTPVSRIQKQKSGTNNEQKLNNNNTKIKTEAKLQTGIMSDIIIVNNDNGIK